MKKLFLILSLLTLSTLSVFAADRNPLFADPEGDNLILFLPKVEEDYFQKGKYTQVYSYQDSKPAGLALIPHQVAIESIKVAFPATDKNPTIYMAPYNGNHLYFHADATKQKTFDVLNAAYAAGDSIKHTRDRVEFNDPLNGKFKVQKKDTDLTELTASDHEALKKGLKDYPTKKYSSAKMMGAWFNRELFNKHPNVQNSPEITAYRKIFGTDGDAAHIAHIAATEPAFLKDETLKQYDSRIAKAIAKTPSAERDTQIRTMLADKDHGNIYTLSCVIDDSTELTNFFNTLSPEEHLKILEPHCRLRTLKGNLPPNKEKKERAKLLKHPETGAFYTYNKGSKDAPSILRKVVHDDAGNVSDFIEVTGKEKLEVLRDAREKDSGSGSWFPSHDDASNWTNKVLPALKALPKFAPEPEPKPAPKDDGTDSDTGDDKKPLDDDEKTSSAASHRSRSSHATPPARPIGGGSRAGAPVGSALSSGSAHDSSVDKSAPGTPTEKSRTKEYAGRAIQGAGVLSLLYAAQQLVARHKAASALEAMNTTDTDGTFNPLFDEPVETFDPIREAALKRQRNAALRNALIAIILGGAGIYGGHRLAAAAA